MRMSRSANSGRNRTRCSRNWIFWQTRQPGSQGRRTMHLRTDRIPRLLSGRISKGHRVACSRSFEKQLLRRSGPTSLQPSPREFDADRKYQADTRPIVSYRTGAGRARDDRPGAEPDGNDSSFRSEHVAKGNRFWRALRDRRRRPR